MWRFFRMVSLKVISKKLTPPLKPEHKYYRKQGNKFIICKYINGKTRIFGSVDSEETAKSIVNILFKNDWDVNSLPLKLREELQPRKPKYYSYGNGKYNIYRVVNGKSKFYGSLDTVSEAEEMVSELINVGWNVECLPLEYQEKLSRKPKYYTFIKNENAFQVQRFIGGVKVYFGYYRTEDEAKARVEELKNNNWDGLL